MFTLTRMFNGEKQYAASHGNDYRMIPYTTDVNFAVKFPTEAIAQFLAMEHETVEVLA